MTRPELDRHTVKMQPLSTRHNKQQIERDHVAPDHTPGTLPDASAAIVEQAVKRIRTARESDKPVMLAFGAHAIKNGLGPVLIHLIENGYVTHLATNGAGVIHDWEFAYQGQSSEDVEQMVAQGQFGNWEETGFYINLAINVGAYEGRGYGEAVGAMIVNEGLTIPSAEELRTALADQERAGAAADLLSIVQRFELSAGVMPIAHPYSRYSAQAQAFRLGVPFTAHPMIGHDIIYNHPMNHGGCLGRAALRDFLCYAEAVSRIDGGVYMSVGSAVMSPMVFEKSFSMAQNLALQRGERIDNHFILVVDLAESTWDWSQGEPPEEHPAYYLRYNKTFSRMGGTMRYICADNRDFLLTLSQALDAC